MATRSPAAGHQDGVTPGREVVVFVGGRLLPHDELRHLQTVLTGHKLIIGSATCGYAVINRLQVFKGSLPSTT